MATGLLALLDDITTILDDVATMSKVAAEKTAGLAGDDLAVNAEGLVGLAPARELPIVGKVALGSLGNKVILVPLALALPKAAIAPLLMIGGAYLCYEGVHKVLHKSAHADEEHHRELVQAATAGPEELAKLESGKVRQAILTDVVLSAEIVAVALGALADQPFPTRALALSVVAVVMTVGIYGVVAALVKLDDIGLHLQRAGTGARARVGKLLVDGTPWLMRGLSIVGTIAMFLVGGGIVLHGVPAVGDRVHHAIEAISHAHLAQSALSTGASLVAGVIVGLVVAGVVGGISRVASRSPR